MVAGDDFVLMRDANQVWRCLEDKCSHRQALGLQLYVLMI